MATFEALRTRVGNRTRRSSETDFTTIVNDAFTAFLELAAQMHDFDEMRGEVTGVFSSGSVEATLESGSLSGFQTDVHHVFGARVGLTDGSRFSYPIDIKTIEWLNRYFPDRNRSSAISQRPAFCALRGSVLHLQAPTNEAYTITLVVSHIPNASGTNNPLPSLDEALVSWASYEIYEATEQYDAATRQWDKAQALLNRAILSDRQPGVIQQAIPRRSRFFDEGYRFNLSDLQNLYPDT